MPSGVLLADKPSGETSAGVVRILKKRHRLKKIGHLGTLDPMATGVLPLCVDEGTKIAQFLVAADKAYAGEIRLGVSTDTLDITGSETERGAVPEIGANQLCEVAASLEGQRGQKPPMYSAVKVSGRKLYEFARSGIEIEREARPVRVDRFELFPGASSDMLGFRVECSKGTYVRVLASEVGALLGCPATLASLRRTRFGPFDVSECHSLATLEACRPDELPLLSPLEALRETPKVEVEAKLAYEIAVGRKGALVGFSAPEGATRAALVAPDGELLAIIEQNGHGWALRRMLYPAASELYRPHAQC